MLIHANNDLYGSGNKRDTVNFNFVPTATFYVVISSCLMKNFICHFFSLIVYAQIANYRLGFFLLRFIMETTKFDTLNMEAFI